MGALWHVVGTVVLGVVAILVRDAAASRRGRRHDAGARVRCPGRLGLDGDRPRRGRLTLAGSGIRWTGGPRDEPVDLTGSVVLAHTPDLPPRRWHDGDEEGLLHLAVPSGRTATLRLGARDVTTVAAALASDAPDGLPAATWGRPAVRGWARVALGLVAVWFLGWTWLVISGDTVRATVTSPGTESGLCDVRWAAAGGGNATAEVDCDDPPTGSQVTVWALGPPFVGEAVDPYWTTIAVVLLGWLAAVPGAVHVVRRRPRPRTAPAAVPWEALRVDQLDLRRTELVADRGEDLADVSRRLTPHALRRVPAGGWESARHPEGAQVPRAPRRVAAALWTPVTALAVAVAVPAAVAGTGLAGWALLVAAGATAWAAPRALAVGRQTAAVHRAAGQPAVPAPGVLTATAAGRPLVLVLLTDGGAAAVPVLEPLPSGAVGAFATGAGAGLRARGEITEGGAVVLELPDGRLLLSAAPTTVLDASAVHAALVVPELLPPQPPGSDPWDDDPWDDDPGYDDPGPD